MKKIERELKNMAVPALLAWGLLMPGVTIAQEPTQTVPFISEYCLPVSDYPILSVNQIDVGNLALENAELKIFANNSLIETREVDLEAAEANLIELRQTLLQIGAFSEEDLVEPIVIHQGNNQVMHLEFEGYKQFITLDIDTLINLKSDDSHLRVTAVHSVVEEFAHTKQNKVFGETFSKLTEIDGTLDNYFKEFLVQTFVSIAVKDIFENSDFLNGVDERFRFILMERHLQKRPTQYPSIDSDGLINVTYEYAKSPYDLGHYVSLNLIKEGLVDSYSGFWEWHRKLSRFAEVLFADGAEVSEYSINGFMEFTFGIDLVSSVLRGYSLFLVNNPSSTNLHRSDLYPQERIRIENRLSAFPIPSADLMSFFYLPYSQYEVSEDPVEVAYFDENGDVIIQTIQQGGELPMTLLVFLGPKEIEIRRSNVLFPDRNVLPFSEFLNLGEEARNNYRVFMENGGNLTSTGLVLIPTTDKYWEKYGLELEGLKPINIGGIEYWPQQPTSIFSIAQYNGSVDDLGGLIYYYPDTSTQTSDNAPMHFNLPFSVISNKPLTAFEAENIKAAVSAPGRYSPVVTFNNDQGEVFRIDSMNTSTLSEGDVITDLEVSISDITILEEDLSQLLAEISGSQNINLSYVNLNYSFMTPTAQTSYLVRFGDNGYTFDLYIGQGYFNLRKISLENGSIQICTMGGNDLLHAIEGILREAYGEILVGQ